MSQRACFHGGAFWDGVGDDFHALFNREVVVPADVLDAWFPPAPAVLEALHAHLSFLCRTSPPIHAEGLVCAIAEARGLPQNSVLVGAGSSALLFLACTRWLTARSRVLLPDPTYGEYAHVLENVIGCRVDRFPLSRANHYELDLEAWSHALAGRRYDMAVLVNPNNPTGQHVPRSLLEPALTRVPSGTRVCIDEAYGDYVGQAESLEPFAAQSENVVVCKSLSKGLALSGLRVGYLCAALSLINSLRPFVPPWAVSLPAQVAAVLALRAPDYYAARYAETHELRASLAQGLRRLPNLTVTESVANWLLVAISPDSPSAAEIVRRCRERGVYLRDGATFSPQMATQIVRIAVRDAADNARILDALSSSLAPSNACSDIFRVNAGNETGVVE